MKGYGTLSGMTRGYIPHNIVHLSNIVVIYIQFSPQSVTGTAPYITLYDRDKARYSPHYLTL
jgi:hypothetical protein